MYDVNPSWIIILAEKKKRFLAILNGFILLPERIFSRILIMTVHS